MKLRCTENSIRLRLRKSDIEKLAVEKSIAESIHFGIGNSFIFRLSIRTTEGPKASFEKGSLEVELPEELAHTWINSQQVGIEHDQVIDNQTNIHLLIEKDFPCKDRVDEDKSDTFQELVPGDEQAC